jgi:hypothetical protein
MALLAPTAVGVIEIEDASSAADRYFGRYASQGSAEDVVRVLRGDEPPRAELPDQLLRADTERLTDELLAEYAAVCAVIEEARW